ncbi:MAG: 4Fe-4S binding protein [Pseudomonadota bacterium]
MTPTIVRNFIGKRAIRRYPYVVRPPFENARGEIHNEIHVCNFCGVCAESCPFGSLHQKRGYHLMLF